MVSAVHGCKIIHSSNEVATSRELAPRAFRQLDIDELLIQFQHLRIFICTNAEVLCE